MAKKKPASAFCYKHKPRRGRPRGGSTPGKPCPACFRADLNSNKVEQLKKLFPVIMVD